MPAKLSTDPETAIVTLEAEGKITVEDFDRIAPEIEAFISAHGTIRLLEIVQSFEGVNAELLWRGLKLDRKLLPHISHCAVVSDIGWMTPLAKAAGAVISTKLRTFAMADLEDAKSWVANPD
ncbi:MAG: STAS/SEC14 domain-containing protein [Pseudomonadota bacterium]